MDSCSDINDSSLQTEETFEFRPKEEDEGVDDSFKLMALLQEFQLCDIYPILFASGVTFHSLDYLDRDDIKDAIPNIGQRAMFREKLFAWRKQKTFLNSDEEMRLQNIQSRVNTQCAQTTETAPNNQADQNPQNAEVSVWLSTQREYRHARSPSPSPVNSLIVKRYGSLQEVSTLLNLTAKGKSALKYYHETKKLTNAHRDDIINIIIEEIMTKDIRLTNQDFATIVQQIVALFPSEKYRIGYYYVPRYAKKNPSGKLYSKYFNTKTKKRKLSMANMSRSTCDENTIKRPSLL